MKETRFLVNFLLLLIVQICIANFFRLSQYVMLSILPAMILLIPIRHGTIPALFIAFATAVAVDLLSDGLLGLNVLALVPVAFCRVTSPCPGRAYGRCPWPSSWPRPCSSSSTSGRTAPAPGRCGSAAYALRPRWPAATSSPCSWPASWLPKGPAAPGGKTWTSAGKTSFWPASE